MYRVVHKFYDLKDNNHAYSVGDLFPHNGACVAEDRVVELMGENNRLGCPLIKEIEEKPKRVKKKKEQ